MTNRRSFLLKSFMAAGAVSFFEPLQVFAGFAPKPLPVLNNNKLTILHTSNLYGQQSGLDISEKMSGLGGLQNVGRKISEIRNERVPLLTLHAGNMISGNQQNHEEHLRYYKSMYAVGYDAVIPGKTDLRSGSTYFEQLIKESGLCAVGGKEHSLINPELLPYHLITKGNSRIGIIKLVPELKSFSLKNTTALMNITASQLKEVNRCTLVVCMTNLNKLHTLKLAEHSLNIDVIASSIDTNSIHNTHLVRNKNNQEVILSYAGTKGSLMSRIDFTFNNQGEKINMALKAIFTGGEHESYTSLSKRFALSNA